jgi:hypothetical protein
MRDNLTGLRFICTGPTSEGGERIWNCERSGPQSYLVDLIADSDDALLSATIHTFPTRGLDVDGARSTIAQIASVQYENGNPAVVADWVRSGVGASNRPENIRIGGVVFSFLVTDPPNVDIAVEGY